MPQILPSQPTFAGQFGAGLGQSLAQLVENKVSQMHAQQNQQRLGSKLQKLGYTPEQSELLSALPQNDLLSALQSLAPSQATQASQQLAQVQPESEQGPSLQNALQQLKAQTPELSGMELLKQAGTQKLGEIGLGQKQAQQPGFAPLNAQELFEQARLQGITLTPEQQQKINNKVAAINASEDLQKQLQNFIAKQQQVPIQQQLPPQNIAQPNQPLFKKPLTEAEKLGRQAQIERVNKPYNDALDKRITSADEVLDKGQKMLELLQSGDVASGLSGYKPNVFQSADSQEFNSLGDDAAAALSGLQSGVQTISKIKFNKERKATLSQQRETQFRRVKDMMKTAEKILVEGDIRNNLLTSGMQPSNISSEVMKVYSKIKNDIPEVPENATIGKEFVDPQTGAIWTVGSNRMIFNGFAERRK